MNEKEKFNKIKLLKWFLDFLNVDLQSLLPSEKAKLAIDIEAFSPPGATKNFQLLAKCGTGLVKLLVAVLLRGLIWQLSNRHYKPFSVS